VLRLWRPGDDGDRAVCRRLAGDPAVVRFLYDDELDPDRADSQLTGRGSVIEGPGGWMNLAVEVTGTGEVVGDVGLAWLGDDHRQAEIGYKFLPAHHGHGYATEAAAAAMIDLAVTTLDAHRVRARLDARNAASARVLDRLGMRHEAHLVLNEWVEGGWTDEASYAILASEWTGHRDRP
jgi:RimJ/RimL family protein N-acetyltransferase